MYGKAFCIPAKDRPSKPTSDKATDGSNKVGPPQAGTLPDCLPGKLWFLSSKMWFGWQTTNFWGLPLAPFSQCSCYYVTQLLHYIMWVRDHLSFSHVDGQTRVAPSGLDWAGGNHPEILLGTITGWGGVVFPDPNPEWRRVYRTRVSHMYVHTCVEDGQTPLVSPTPDLYPKNWKS